VEKIAGSDTAVAQMWWSYLYPELLKHVLELCPASVHMAWRIITQRIGNVEPNEDDYEKDGAHSTTSTIKSELSSIMQRFDRDAAQASARIRT
jgi:hypothetical protein